jgi:hypothetical protein
MEQSPSWEANLTQLVKKFLAFYGTRMFITVYTARHWSLSWARWIQSIPSQPIFLTSGLILSSHLHLDLPSSLFPSGFPTKILYWCWCWCWWWWWWWQQQQCHCLVSYWTKRMKFRILSLYILLSFFFILCYFIASDCHETLNAPANDTYFYCFHIKAMYSLSASVYLSCLCDYTTQPNIYVSICIEILPPALSGTKG